MYEKLEDELIRTRKFRNEQQEKVAELKKLGFPKQIIKYHEYLATLTHKGFLNHLARQEELENNEKKEYIKNNKMNEDVVKNIFQWFDNNGNTIPLHIFESRVLTDRILDPLGPGIGMSEDDYYYDLYTPLINSLIKQVIEKRHLEEENNT